MPRMVIGATLVAAFMGLAIGQSAHAQNPSKTGSAASEFGLARDVISVAVAGRHGSPATGNCLVWASAEGLGVGPNELGGYHGVNMNINLAPLPNENPKGTSFELGIKSLAAEYPTTPAWLLNTIQKNHTAIEAACRVDRLEPFVVYSITEKDKRN